ncbi:MAG: hypothetical protein BroJett007_33230 [Chloroflexota bacterium]|nr:MAG: hypothetical protein BroJett007_33230 [Chloroflexota bacterium]
MGEPAGRPYKATSVISPFSVCSVPAFVFYSRLITWHSALREALTPGPSPTRGRGEKDGRGSG